MARSVVVIGAGPGGEAAAKRAAARGAAVTLVEKNRLGGLCLNWGCIPSKTLLEPVRLLHQMRRQGGLFSGVDALRLSWPALQKKKDAVVDSLRAALTQNYKRLGVRVLEGRAEFVDGRKLRVSGPAGEETLTFDAAILATGSAPFFPAPFDDVRDRALDSDKALALPELPGTLLVVGAGAVGCEFAGLFQELGVKVTLIEKKEDILPGEDPAVVRVLRAGFESMGMRVLTGTTAASISAAGGWKVKLTNGEELSADQALVAIGRRPVTDGLGLDRAAVAVKNGAIGVNDFLQTSNPHVYAVGDVNGMSLLAHAAAAQGETAVDHVFGESHPYRHDLVPRCLYTWPEVASVGEWSYSAKNKGVDAKTQRFFFQGSAKALAASEPEGFIQVVSEKNSGKILGAQIVGPHATELIHIFSVALAAGQTVTQLRGVIFAHPTLGEGVKEALSR